MTEDPNAKRIIRPIERNGFRVAAETESLTTTDSKTGETFIVRGNDMLTMAAELTGQVGIDLMDG
jgi:hypothetical protein